jgi:protein phosphatase
MHGEDAMALTVTHAGLSDRGRTHLGNEDRWFGDPQQGLYIVADGMGHEEPAELIISNVPDLIRRHLSAVTDLRHPDAAQGIRTALTWLNALVRRMGQTNPDSADWEGLGAVVVLALVRDDQALLAHVGDSRIYLLRDSALEAMTRDHSFLQELVARGTITAAEAARRRFNGGPTRFIGMDDPVNPDVRTLQLRNGDRLLLCSDGLTGMVPEQEIEAILINHPVPEDACARLVEAANVAGGDDNITALVIAVH